MPRAPGVVVDEPLDERLNVAAADGRHAGAPEAREHVAAQVALVLAAGAVAQVAVAASVGGEPAGGVVGQVLARRRDVLAGRDLAGALSLEPPCGLVGAGALAALAA